MPAEPLLGRARTSPDDLAVSDGTTSLSWSELVETVGRLEAALLDIASAPHERMAVLGENAVPTLLTHAAGLSIGVGTVATSRQLTPDELVEQFRDCGAVAAVCGRSSVDAVLAAAPAANLRTVVVHGVDPAPAGARLWTDWLAAAPDAPAAPRPGPPLPILVYTSGTTGRARGAEVRWIKEPVTTVTGYLEALAAKPNFPPGPHLVVGPLQHNAPLTSVRHLLTGEPVIIAPKFDPERVLQLIADYQVTSTVMVPTHFQRLLDLPAELRAGYDVSSLRFVAQTGAACPVETKKATIEWFGPVISESYGGSEVGSLCRIGSEEWIAHPGSVGRAIPPFEVVVLGESQQELGPGEVGILGFRSPPEHGIRYHDDPEKTAAAYIAPGVFTLGDVGYVDEDGFVYITDRIADLVVSGGVNIYPAECERVLSGHPAVAEVAAIGVPHPDLGESLLALVVPEGAAVDPAELDRFCRERLAAYKCPKAYEVRTELPRNAMGKLDKRAVRRPYWDSDRTIAG